VTALIAPGTDQWLKLVTASKVSAILGLSPYESPRSLWHKMRGDIPPSAQTRVQARGHFLEAGVLDWFFADHPELSRHGGEVTLTRDDLPWAAATPDDLATDPDGLVIGVDAKTAARDANGNDETAGWGEPGTDQVPLHLLTQAMWVMHIGKFDRFLFVRLGPFLDRDEFVVTYDADLAADIEARCFLFWLSLYDGEPPELDGRIQTYDALRIVVPVGEGGWEAPDDLARELCESRTAVDTAQARYNLARSRVLDAMGDAKQVTYRGQVLGQKQRTKNGCALYPPRNPVDLSVFTTSEAPEAVA
jgi:hypothetical protein